MRESLGLRLMSLEMRLVTYWHSGEHSAQCETTYRMEVEDTCKRSLTISYSVIFTPSVSSLLISSDHICMVL